MERVPYICSKNGKESAGGGGEEGENMTGSYLNDIIEALKHFISDKESIRDSRKWELENDIEEYMKKQKEIEELRKEIQKKEERIKEINKEIVFYKKLLEKLEKKKEG